MREHRRIQRSVTVSPGVFPPGGVSTPFPITFSAGKQHGFVGFSAVGVFLFETKSTPVHQFLPGIPIL